MSLEQDARLVARLAVIKKLTGVEIQLTPKEVTPPGQLSPKAAAIFKTIGPALERAINATNK